MPFVENQWKPNKKQSIFLSLPTSIKEGFYGGGAGSGKSEVLLVYPLIHGWHNNPKFKQVFQRRTYPELRNEIVPRSREFYLKFGALFNKQEMSWTFPREDQFGSGFRPNGAVIHLGHCENEDDVHQYDSMEINLYTPDELTSFTEYIYLYIGFTRVRTSDPSLPAIIRAAGMPGGVGHGWTKKRFVDFAPKGSKILVGKGGNKRIYIHSTLADNPNIDPAYAQSLEALPKAELEAKKYGSWDAYLGQVFDEFRDKKYPDEPDNAIHVVDSFDIPSWWPKIVSMDWGYAPPAMTWIGYGAISPEKRLYIYREQWYQKVRIEEWCAEIKPYIHMESIRLVKLCKSAGQDRGQEHTIQQQISAAIDFPVQLTSNQPGSRVAGKMLLHEYLRWKPKYQHNVERGSFNQDLSEWLLRNKGLDAYNEYLQSFVAPEPETNLPKLQIFNTCPKLIEAIHACIYDKTNPQDVAEFPGDDPYDGIRYLVDTADRFFGEATDESLKLQQREYLTKKLAETQDWTSFYRNARHLEREQNTNPIRRYHRAH